MTVSAEESWSPEGYQRLCDSSTEKTKESWKNNQHYLKILHWLRSGLFKEIWERTTAPGHTYTNSRTNIVRRYAEPALNKWVTKASKCITEHAHVFISDKFPQCFIKESIGEPNLMGTLPSARKFQKPETAAQTCCLYFVSFALYKYTRRNRRLYWQMATDSRFYCKAH